MNRTYLAISAAVLVLAVHAATILMLVTFARDLERKKIEAETATGRIETMKDAQELRDEIETLPDDGLFNRLGRWIMPD